MIFLHKHTRYRSTHFALKGPPMGIGSWCKRHNCAPSLHATCAVIALSTWLGAVDA